MAVKASLRIQLFADEVVVAESEDELLWRQVLAAIQTGDGVQSTLAASGPPEKEPPRAMSGGEDDVVEAVARELGVSSTQLVGACDPSSDAPFIHLDAKCWETFKKNTPARGPRAIAGMKLAATMLCLWFQHGGIGRKPTQAEALTVLDDLGVDDRNPSRAIANCSWLQSRGGGIQLNPAETSIAIAVAKAFITKSEIDRVD